MRGNLYLWNQPAAKCLVVSGIEFRDMVPELENTGGVVLLRHRFDRASFDVATRLEFVTTDRLAVLADDDVYGYGDFCCVDFGADVTLSDLTDEALAELLFFAHLGRPLKGVHISELNNLFLYWSHDDGWFARIYYTRWAVIEETLRRPLSRLVSDARVQRTLNILQTGDAAFWCGRGHVVECDQTEDIDSLQQRIKM
jgi:hypothetical protein